MDQMKPAWVAADVMARSVMYRPEVISYEYVDEMARLHMEDRAYGSSGGAWWAEIAKLADEVGTTDVLDYGCGKGTLADKLGRERPDITVAEYDPAIIDKWDVPGQHDIVACLDVLEHIEYEKLEAVLDDIHRCMGKAGMLSIAHGPATRWLADGRNAHIILEPTEWWKPRLKERFFLHKTQWFEPTALFPDRGKVRDPCPHSIWFVTPRTS